MHRLSIVLIAAVLCGCNAEVPQAPAASATSTAPEFREVADVKQVMNWIMEPSADVVWDAVGSVMTEAGEESLAPKTDEEWTAVRNAAATVAEAANLLLTPGRLRDREDWVKHSHQLTKTAQEALAAAEAKDVDALFTAGGDMYIACTECHAQYAIGLQRLN
ncbi:MAG TPA: hypothetical protein VIL28_02575 [Steroidobacteraceae bacterium]